MQGKELLERIWNLEKVDRPAFIVEETVEIEKVDFVKTKNHKFSDLLNTKMFEYNRLVKGMDDNVPTLYTALGTHIIPSAFGGKEREFEDGHKYLAGPVIFSASDVDRLKPADMVNSLLGEQLELIKYFSDATNGEIPIRIGDIQNPLGVADMMWDTNDFYTALVEEPEQVHKLLRLITEVTIELVSKIKEFNKNLNPINWPLIWAPKELGIYLADDTMSMISPSMYEEYGVPYNNILSRQFGGLFLHSCTMNEKYFDSIIKNEGLRSVNFAAQYSSDMSKIFDYFGGKVVILPHYVHTDSPQIGTVIEFIDKVLDCWTPLAPTIIYVKQRPEGGMQQEIFEKFKERGFNVW